jgi:hypothetical protein
VAGADRLGEAGVDERLRKALDTPRKEPEHGRRLEDGVSGHGGKSDAEHGSNATVRRVTLVPLG